MFEKLRGYPAEKTVYIVGLGVLLFAAGGCLLSSLSAPPFPDFPCTFRALTGYPCPGCGGTRAVAALFHGQLLRAVKYNAFAVYAVIYYILFMCSYTLHLCTRKKTPCIPLRLWHIYMGAVILIVPFAGKCLYLYMLKK